MESNKAEKKETPESPDTAVKVIEKQAQKRIFKIIVIGDSNVGKTCLTYRFCCGKFPDKTEATIGVDFRERLVDVDSEQLKVKRINFKNIFSRHKHPESLHGSWGNTSIIPFFSLKNIILYYNHPVITLNDNSL